MATKKSTPVKKQEEQVFYIVTPDTAPLSNMDEVPVFTTVEQAFFDAQENYEAHPSENKFFLYEVKKRGIVNLKIDVQIS